MHRAIAIAEKNYQASVLKALVAAAVLHLLLFVLIPPFDFTPYRMTGEPLVLVDMEPVQIPLDTPDEIPQPRMAPPMVDNEPGDEVGTMEFPKTIQFTPGDLVPAVSGKADTRPAYVPYDRAPVLVRIVRAEYPRLARMAGIEGTVMFKILVGADGRVGEISVLSSNVTIEMEKAAMSAVSQFVFEPALQGIMPVPAMMKVPYTFDLH